MKVARSIKHLVFLILFLVFSYIVTTYGPFEYSIRTGVFMVIALLVIIVYRDIRREAKLTQDELKEAEELLSKMSFGSVSEEEINRLQELWNKKD